MNILQCLNIQDRYLLSPSQRPVVFNHFGMENHVPAFGNCFWHNTAYVNNL